MENIPKTTETKKISKWTKKQQLQVLRGSTIDISSDLNEAEHTVSRNLIKK